MRKMMNKKGFTLVELMIVVVILGILVAIAVPIFSAVTKNAKKKACLSNIRIIEGNLSSFLTTGNNGEPFGTAAAATAKLTDAAFTGLFKGGAVPTCKSAGGEGTAYTITLTDGAGGTINYSVVCADPNCPVNES